MKRPIYLLLFGACLALAAPRPALAGRHLRPKFAQSMVADELIVERKAGASEQDLKDFAQANGLKLIKKFGHAGLYHFKIMNGKAPRDLAAILAQRSDLVKNAEPNLIRHAHYTPYSFPNDPYYQNNSATLDSDEDIPDEWYVAITQRDKAWNTAAGGMSTWSAGLSTVLISDVDTGINSNHDDLKNQTLAGFNSTTNTTGTTDNEGHGTHVASMISIQTNNGLGLCGGANGCRNLPVKASDQGSFFLTDEISGVEWAADHGASVINMSFGGTDSSSEELAAMNYALNKGILLTASSGNGAQPVSDGGEGNLTEYPAGYPGVLSVGATYIDDSWEFYSTHQTTLFCMAPDGIVGCSNTNNSGYDLDNDGTSFAAPGAAALGGVLISNGVAAYECVSRIARTCDKVNPSGSGIPSGGYPYSATKALGTWSDHFGYGRINFYRAMSTLVAPVSNTAASISGSIVLTWSAPPLDDSPSEPVTGYHVYRSLVPGGPYSLIQSVASTTASDSSAAPGVTEYYVVKGVNSNHFETLASAELSCVRVVTPTPTFTYSPTITLTPTITPTLTVTPTRSPTPTASPSPTITKTFVYEPSSLGKTLLAPVPAVMGSPVCLYFSRAPQHTEWVIFNSAGESVATLSFQNQVRQCWDTGQAAPGLYFARIRIEYADKSEDTVLQKLVVTR